MATSHVGTAPESDFDPYRDEALLDPWPGYRLLRDAGPAVWLPQYEMFALTRYASVRFGVLRSDGAEHDALREMLVLPLTPKALRPLRDAITAQAEAAVDRVVEKGSFDAVSELAQQIPVTIVSNAIGLPEKGRERMLVWAKSLFNCVGPMNARTVESFPILNEMMEYATNEEVRGKLKPGNWSEAIYDAVDRGEVAPEACPVKVDYMGPSMDTTIFAISNAVWLFAQHPDQWDLVREDPSLIPAAINRHSVWTRRSRTSRASSRRT